MNIYALVKNLNKDIRVDVYKLKEDTENEYLLIASAPAKEIYWMLHRGELENLYIHNINPVSKGVIEAHVM